MDNHPAGRLLKYRNVAHCRTRENAADTQAMDLVVVEVEEEAVVAVVWSLGS